MVTCRATGMQACWFNMACGAGRYRKGYYYNACLPLAKSGHTCVFLCTEGNRINFFESTLKALHEAATKGYETLHASCVTIHDDIHQKYPDIPFLRNANGLLSMRFHAYSKSILPHEFKHLVPIFCNGDGNCLYRYHNDFYYT